jgi:subtilisin family serine protease
LNFSTQNLGSVANNHRSQDSSEVWLQKVTEINRYLAQQSSTPTTPIKIAVLDTGCDREAVFFHSPARSSRIKCWKDWVDDSADSEDCDGHGTHAVALAMKMAPAADIFIARVAKDKEKLEGASDAVAKVSGVLVDPWKGLTNTI